MNELQLHIEKINAESQAWVDANPGSWAGMLTTDLEHWNSYGVYTAEDFLLWEARTTYYELYKDRYGFRCDYSALRGKSLAELQMMIDELPSYIKAEYR